MMTIIVYAILLIVGLYFFLYLLPKYFKEDKVKETVEETIETEFKTPEEKEITSQPKAKPPV